MKDIEKQAGSVCITPTSLRIVRADVTELGTKNIVKSNCTHYHDEAHGYFVSLFTG